MVTNKVDINLSISINTLNGINTSVNTLAPDSGLSKYIRQN